MDVALRTERLALRPLVPLDTAAIVLGLDDFEVARFLTLVPFPYTERHAIEWLAGVAAYGRDKVVFAIDLPGSGLIGVIGLEPILGYWLARPFHGRGLMTEAATAVLDWHFARHPAEAVESGAHVGNAASLAVQRKLGFVETGRVRRIPLSLGYEIESIRTVLTPAAFQAARTRLGGR